MPDKNPKNLKKIKERAEEKHEGIQGWKHETPTEKQKTLKQKEVNKNSESAGA